MGIKCSYCKKKIENALPHKCKFCRLIHCDNHLLPEGHNCSGLKPAKHFRFKRNIKSYSETDASYNKSRRDNYDKHKQINYKIKFKFPRLKINRTFQALILAILTYILAVNFTNYSIFLWIEAGAWLYFSFFLYKRVFKWANEVRMSDDLAFFGLRILGGVVLVIGVYVGLFVLLKSALIEGSVTYYIPIYSLLLGLIVLGTFIGFRTNRRHKVVGFWRA